MNYNYIFILGLILFIVFISFLIIFPRKEYYTAPLSPWNLQEPYKESVSKDLMFEFKNLGVPGGWVWDNCCTGARHKSGGS